MDRVNQPPALEDLDPLFLELAGLTPIGLADQETLTPRTARTRARHRFARIRQHEQIRTAVPQLPPAGTSIHAISQTHYDFWRWVPHLCELLAKPATLWASTWTMNRQNVDELAQLLDAGTLRAAHVLCGVYFKRRNTDVYGALVEQIRRHRRGGSRLVCFHNHAKVLLVDDGRRYFTIEGSANLCENSNLEQSTLTHSRALHAFHVSWMNEAYDRAGRGAAGRLAELAGGDETPAPGHPQRRIGRGAWSATLRVFDRRRIAQWKSDYPRDPAELDHFAGAIALVIRARLPNIPPAAVVTFPPAGASAALELDQEEPPAHYAALELARAVARLVELPCVDLLRRTDTKDWQHGPQAAIRQRPFSLKAAPPPVVILVDDVLTTGTTLRLARAALEQAGATVYAFTYFGR